MELKKFHPGNRYECPVYSTMKRGVAKDGSLITCFWLPIKDGIRPGHWFKRGVALGCHIGD